MTLIDEIKRQREKHSIYGGRLADALLEIDGVLTDYFRQKHGELVTIGKIGNILWTENPHDK